MKELALSNLAIFWLALLSIICLSFASTMKLAVDKEIRSLASKKYIWGISLLSLLLIFLLGIFYQEERGALLVLALYWPLLFYLGTRLLYLWVFLKAEQRPKTKGFRKDAYFLFSLLLIYLTSIFSLYVYPDLDSQIPSHFDFALIADAWTKKTLTSLLLPSLIALALLGFLYLVSKLALKAKKRPKDPKELSLYLAEKHLSSHLLGTMSVLVTLLISGLQLHSILNSTWTKVLIYLSFLLIYFFIITFIVLLAKIKKRISAQKREEIVLSLESPKEEVFHLGSLVYNLKITAAFYWEDYSLRLNLAHFKVWALLIFLFLAGLALSLLVLFQILAM